MPRHLADCRWHVIIESNHSATENAIAAEAFARYCKTTYTLAMRGKAAMVRSPFFTCVPVCARVCLTRI